jgi:hypothetical protein
VEHTALSFATYMAIDIEPTSKVHFIADVIAIISGPRNQPQEQEQSEAQELE